MNPRPNILLINDDGILAPGLKTLWKALFPLANLWIVAPSTEQSGVGMGITVKSPLTISPVPWEENTPAWSVSGTPADCVRMALNLVCKTQPDLIVSGVNPGSNAGRTILYSGTVGGIIEGSLKRIPGVAFSSTDYLNPQFDKTVEPIRSIVTHLLENPLPPETFLNVTFPQCDDYKGIRLARQGLGYYKESLCKGIHPSGMTYYWAGFEPTDHDNHPESDLHLLEEGFITIVPLEIGELTNHHFFKQHKGAFDRLEFAQESLR
jgi:5'-nucleotidase